MKPTRTIAIAIALLSAGTGLAGEYARLLAEPDLTPTKLLTRFADFNFELGKHPQDAEAFLERKRGDCDDFASLAGRLLTERGCHTKLVVVMMEGETHVVCYVEEAGGFLDFNRRAVADPVVPSDGALEVIADKVAAGFRNRWRMAAQVEYRGNAAVFVDSVFPPAAAPIAATPPGGEAVVATAPKREEAPTSIPPSESAP